MENTVSTTAASSPRGTQPGLHERDLSFQINPFVKLGGLEVFGVIEKAEGRTRRRRRRAVPQYAGDAVYRFLPNEQLFVGGRYNTVGAGCATWWTT
jgi:hypothetical protein